MPHYVLRDVEDGAHVDVIDAENDDAYLGTGHHELQRDGATNFVFEMMGGGLDMGTVDEVLTQYETSLAG